MPERAATSVESEPGLVQALRWIELLADDVGPRRPTGRSEAIAAELMRSELASQGVDAELEAFKGYSTFGLPLGILAAVAVAPSLLPRRLRALRSALALGALAGLASEGGLRWTPVTRLLSRRQSQNLVAGIEPVDCATRTVCLVSHIDSSRSGLMFHPAFVRLLNPWISVQAGGVVLAAGEPLLARTAMGRWIARAARVIVATGLALLVERELRGADVPGANDNASGVAVTAQLAAESARQQLRNTRLVLLITGSEESGLLGAQAFLRAHDTRDWLFVNFDSVGGPATLRWIEREGLVKKWDADPALLRIAERIAREHPELNLQSAGGPIGLTYDTTAVMARGGRALTFVAGNGVIPNYHWPTDTAANVDPETIAQALEAGREMLAAIDRAEAD